MRGSHGRGVGKNILGLPPSLTMPIYPPATIVRVRNHLLHPTQAAATLSAADNDAVADLTVLATWH
jgi:hypothetical protein